MNYREMDEQSKDMLRELGNIGTGHAVTSLSRMLNCSLEMEIPLLRMMKYHEIAGILSTSEEVQTGIIVEVFGKLNGVFLFLMNQSFTDTLLEMMLGEPSKDLMNLDEMERSVICELGNIMCGSYIRALAQLLDMEMDVSVPDLCIDMGGAILSVPLSRLLCFSEDIVLIENVFHLREEDFLCRILLIPELDSVEAMFDKLGV